MTSSTTDTQRIRVTTVSVAEHLLTVELSDGRTISASLSWYPRICHGSLDERTDWRLVGGGLGIHWPQLDEDISVENLIFGQPSSESQASLKRWLDNRASGPNSTASSTPPS